MSTLLQILEDVTSSDYHSMIAQKAECWQRIKPQPDVEYRTIVDVPGSKTYRFLLLLTKKGDEKLLDLVLDNERFSSVAAVLKEEFPGWHYVEELPVGQDEEF
jgi:hypothetical protein